MHVPFLWGNWARGVRRTAGWWTLLAVAAWLAVAPARAGLVWTPEGGWEVEGGGVLPLIFGDEGTTHSALEAMNQAKAAQEKGSYWSALRLYDRVIQDYPTSVFAPEALYEEGIIYLNRHEFDSAFDAFNQISQKYPEYPRFNTVIGKQFDVAQAVQHGERPYKMWGYMPWFRDYSKAPDYYEGLLKNAPYSEYAPLALWNIAEVARQGTGRMLIVTLFTGEMDKPEVALDALDRLVNNYPQSMLASDAYMEMADIYASLVNGAPYDQGSTQDAMRYYEDYLYLFKGNPDAALAQHKLGEMQDTYARSKLILGDFFYYYRNSNRAALIFYNDAITLAPQSPAADQARAQIDLIRRGVPPPMTPYDWVFGRYKEASHLAYEAEAKTPAAAESFPQSKDAFAETPGAETTETVQANGQPHPDDVPAAPSAPTTSPVDAGFLKPDGSSPPPLAPGEQPGGSPLLK